MEIGLLQLKQVLTSSSPTKALGELGIDSQITTKKCPKTPDPNVIIFQQDKIMYE